MNQIIQLDDYRQSLLENYTHITFKQKMIVRNTERLQKTQKQFKKQECSITRPLIYIKPSNHKKMLFNLSKLSSAQQKSGFQDAADKSRSCAAQQGAESAAGNPAKSSAGNSRYIETFIRKIHSVGQSPRRLVASSDKPMRACHHQ